MLIIEFNLSILLLAGFLLAAFAVGYFIRSSQIHMHRKKIMELEKEMLNNHAQILELEKEKAALIKQMRESKIPVIPIKSPKEEANRKKA